MATTKITRKWQVTIPAEIREELELEMGQSLTVRRVNNVIQLEKLEGVGSRTAGIFASYAKGLPTDNIEELRASARQAAADETAQSLDMPE